MKLYVYGLKLIFALYFDAVFVKGFKVYWNVPSKQCQSNSGTDLSPLLRNYGILVNDGDRFQGETVTIFYEAQLGLYPRILKSGKFENGGIPQRGNLEKHLAKAVKDLNKIIPGEDFSGLGIIDWEAWRPVWEFNWVPLKMYQDTAIEYAKQLNPTLSPATIIEIAKSQWENSSKSYMLETLRLAEKMRPQARWCYYLFPDCYNYNGESPDEFRCSKNIMSGNEKLSWLWKASTAVCPSIYVYASQLEKYSLKQRTWRDNGRLKEALRVASPDAKIFPYVNYFLDKETLPQEEFWRLMAQVAASGADGAVIWGSSASVSSKELCENLEKYIIDTIGPAAEKVAWKSDLCSKEICNSNGRCTWPRDVSVKAWHHFKDESPAKFYAGDIECRCSEGYTGRFCQDNKNAI